MKHLERALDQQNQWWKYLVVFLSGFFVSGLIGAIPLVAVIAYQNSGDIPPGALVNPAEYGVSHSLGLFLMLLPFVVGLIIAVRLFKRLHRRSLTETINGTARIRRERILWGAIVWGLLTMICFLLEYAINPGNYKFNFEAGSFFPLLLISVLIIPLQAGFEEIMFRGYLAQGLAAWTGSRWVVLVVPSVLFGLMHAANPEIEAYGFWLTMPSYVMIGFALGLISILDDGIEIAMGAHAVNNILGSVLLTYKSSAFETPALFYQMHVNPGKDSLVLIIVCVAFVAVLSYKYKWTYAVLNRKVRPQSLVGS